MLKTLRITSRIVLALAVCSVLFMIVFGLRGDPDIKAYLQNPGIIQQFQDQASKGDKKEPESPLVAQAHEFALRIDPPPPPPPLHPEQPTVNPDVMRVVEQQEPPRPKGPVSAKFELLATVQCQTDPARSMVLLKEATGKEEWFWLGEKVGHLKIDEVRNGSAIFSQDGREPQELFVPAKPQVKSLLKGEEIASVSSSIRPGSIDIQLGEGLPSSATDVQTAVSEQGSPAQVMTESAASLTQRGASARIRRLRTGVTAPSAAPQGPERTVPRQPTPEEQKASIDSSIQSIQEIMSHQEGVGDAKQLAEENEAWMKLLKSLQSEKENLESAAKSIEKPAEQPPAGGDKTPQTRVGENDPNQE